MRKHDLFRLVLFCCAGIIPAQADIFGDIGNAVNALGEGVRHLSNEAHKIIRQTAPVDVDFRNGGVTTFNWGGVAQTRYDPRNGTWATQEGFILRGPEDLAAGATAEAIRISRDRARATSRPLPQWVRQVLAPFFPRQLLDNVRYTYDTGATANFTVQQPTMHWSNDVNAIALIDTIVFRSRGMSGGPIQGGDFDIEQYTTWDSIGLWAHEITHLDQYRTLGVEEFARWMIRGYNPNIESPAQSNAERVVNLLAQGMMSGPQQAQQCAPGSGAIFRITVSQGSYFFFGDCNFIAFPYNPTNDTLTGRAVGRFMRSGPGWIAVDNAGQSLWAELLGSR